MHWTSLGLVLVLGCSIEHSLVSCPGDTLCPVGSVCEPVHGGCALPAQLEVCIAIGDGERCVAGTVIGYCLDEICIDPTCGNRIVDPGEICDDGNRDGGDGCNATCLSAERCGDGAVDPAREEECDDRNLVSRDGCDSRCLLETAEWTVDELGPKEAIDDWMTWDPVRNQTLMIADGFVWGWDGTRWVVLADDVPTPDADYDVTFDVTRNRLVMLAMQPQEGDILLPSPPRDTLYEWDGTSWTMSTLTNPIEVGRRIEDFEITYNPITMRVVAFGLDINDVRIFGELDLVTRSWKAPSPPSGTYHPEEGFDIAFDEARGVVVLVSAGLNSASPVVHEWNGTSWTSVGAPMDALRGWTLAYDPRTQRVIAVGGETSGETKAPVQSWNGTSWSSLTAAPSSRLAPGVVFDRARQALVVFGGGLDVSDEIVEWNGAVWRVAPPLGPPVGVDAICASDEGLRRIVCTGSSGTFGPQQTWVRPYAGGWAKLPTSLPATGALSWDPVRRGLIGWTLTGPVMLVGDTVMDLAATGAVLSGYATAMTFDPMTQDTIVTTVEQFGGLTETLRFGQDGVVTDFDSPYFSALAFDARNASILALDYVGVHRLVGETWERVVGPGNGNTMVTNARRGTVEFIAAGLGVLERVGPSWSELPGRPPRAIVGTAVLEQHSGELHVIGTTGSRSRFMLHRRWLGVTPLESCTAGEDVDGDGLAGCDDRDCWDACDACPPFTTCL